MTAVRIRRLLITLGLWLAGTSLALAAVHPVRGFLPDLKFSLQGAGGATVTQQAFAGKVVLMFFGYASCPDICPTTMAGRPTAGRKPWNASTMCC